MAKFNVAINVVIDTEDYNVPDNKHNSNSAVAIVKSILDGESDWPGEGYPAILATLKA